MKALRKQTRPHSYRFTLILAGISDLSEEVRDTLFDSGCDDALLGRRDGKVFLDFDRKAASFRDALLSAITDVERAGLEAQVVRVEPLD